MIPVRANDRFSEHMILAHNMATKLVDNLTSANIFLVVTFCDKCDDEELKVLEDEWIDQIIESFQ